MGIESMRTKSRGQFPSPAPEGRSKSCGISLFQLLRFTIVRIIFTRLGHKVYTFAITVYGQIIQLRPEYSLSFPYHLPLRFMMMVLISS